MLIAANADVSYTIYGSTALHEAAFFGRASTCRVLVDESSSLAAVCNSEGKTPFQVAKARGKAECAAILKAAAEEKNKRNGNVDE